VVLLLLLRREAGDRRHEECSTAMGVTVAVLGLGWSSRRLEPMQLSLCDSQARRGAMLPQQSHGALRY
jgi:hypothetical protein